MKTPEQKAEAAAKAREYYRKNKEYREKRKQQVMERQRKDHDEYLEYQLEYAAKNKKKAVERTAQWRKENPIRRTALRRSEGAMRRLGRGAVYDPKVTDQIEVWLHEPEFECHYCGESFPTEKMTIDHKNSLVNGGNHTIDNVVRSCAKCNRRKGRKNF